MKEEKKRFPLELAILFVVLVALIVCAIVSFRQWRATESTYQQALELIEEEKYRDAMTLLWEIEDSEYKDTSALLAYCEACRTRSKEYAYELTSDLQFNSLSPELEKQIAEKLAEFFAYHQAYIEKKEQETTTTVTETFSAEVPYVGMAEFNIGDTDLGAPSDTVRHSYDIIGGKRYTANIYDFYENGARIFTAKCIEHKVTEVWDRRGETTTASQSTTSKKSTSTTTTEDDDDPYNAADYRNEEDFYDDHYYDFFDYYDAERYYRQHHG